MALDGVYRTLLDERADLLGQVERIERAIVALGFSIPETLTTNEDEPQTDQEPVGRSEPGVLEEDRDAQASEGGTKAMLLRILQEQPNRKFGAPAAMEALRAAGWTTQSSNPRNVVVSTLGKLAREGSIENLGQGIYTYALPPESTPEPTTDTRDAAEEEDAPQFAYVGGSADDPPF